MWGGGATPAVPTKMQGWLHKQPGGKEGITVGTFLRNWERRWFTLDDKTGKLVYYKANSDASELTFAGNLDIEHDTVTEQQMTSVQQRTFIVRTAKDALTLRADDKAAMERWIKALKAVAGAKAEARAALGVDASHERTPPSSGRAGGGGLLGGVSAVQSAVKGGVEMVQGAGVRAGAALTASASAPVVRTVFEGLEAALVDER